MAEMPTEHIPQFDTPIPTESPEIQKLLHDRFYIEEGVNFHKYRVLEPS